MHSKRMKRAAVRKSAAFALGDVGGAIGRRSLNSSTQGR